MFVRLGQRLGIGLGLGPGPGQVLGLGSVLRLGRPRAWTPIGTPKHQEAIQIHSLRDNKEILKCFYTIFAVENLKSKNCRDMYKKKGQNKRSTFNPYINPFKPYKNHRAVKVQVQHVASNMQLRLLQHLHVQQIIWIPLMQKVTKKHQTLCYCISNFSFIPYR